ncbi:general stress protein [Bosea sp. Root483D1]|uniref:pyridoxamine 5'-phosphate oxidase family protein n=1 Tax=Bosea sp. Root483D1 TaxID=1736544 RepID=UPI00070AFC63|nr:pyridoxamine 5'-phosphate oxidase family protein [Bosea sp. Root483D1]KRE20434.1 general stress protein [Bosea sp. Root483D1]
MPTPNELEAKLWKALRSDMTVMLGIQAAGDNLMRPMTVQIDGDADRGPLWIFSARDTELVQALAGSENAFMSFADKGHDLFAKIRGTLALDNDRAVIERLWNRFVAAWYEQGKDDPKLALLRFDPREAEIWENEWSLIAGMKFLFGSDPKQDYANKTANVRLD